MNDQYLKISPTMKKVLLAVIGVALVAWFANGIIDIGANVHDLLCPTHGVLMT